MSPYELTKVVELVGGEYRVSCKVLIDILETRTTMLANEASSIGLGPDPTNVVRGQRREAMLLMTELKRILYPR